MPAIKSVLRNELSFEALLGHVAADAESHSVTSGVSDFLCGLCVQGNGFLCKTSSGKTKQTYCNCDDSHGILFHG